MLRLAFAFLVLALVSAVLGFSGIAGESMYIARVLCVIFVIIFVAGLAYSLVTGRDPGVPL